MNFSMDVMVQQSSSLQYVYSIGHVDIMIAIHFEEADNVCLICCLAQMYYFI